MSCPDENAILAFATGKLPGPRRAAIEAHIDGCSDCAALAGEAAQASDLTPEELAAADTAIGHAAAPIVEEARPERLLSGSVLGRYIVLDLLATGGLGQVYVAYDPDLDRKVALKLLRPLANAKTPDAQAQRWLLREAQAMAKLSHPNVVPVHDVGTHAAGVFIAMELIEGRTLSRWLRESTRTWKEVRDLLLGAGEGLVAAHEAGLVHRDFKPSNILVGDDGRVRVVDFGLARAVAGPTVDPEEPSAQSSPKRQQTATPHLLGEALTEPGTVVGTPPFMSAEQFRGHNVGPWSDQFAFCATLFLGLYGVRPYPERDIDRLRTSILEGKIRPPPADANVPDWLHRVVLKGLDTLPQKRYASMRELLEALVKDRRSRKRQWAALSLAVVLSAGAAGVAAYALAPAPTSADRDAIERIVARAHDAAERAYFVYPPAADADATTAYLAVLELEGMTGPAAELARAAAAELRREFAATLVGLGDTYWEQEGGSGFAADYYGAAVLFGQEDARVVSRTQRTPGQLAALGSKAKEQRFSEGELQTAELLAALARDDVDERRSAAQDALGRSARTPATVVAQLEEVLGPLEPVVVARNDVPSADDSDVVIEEDDPGDEPSAEAPGGRKRKGAGGTRVAASAAPDDEDAVDPEGPPKAAKRDPEAAKSEVALGAAAAKAGRFKVAITHFHRALEHDSRSAAAAAGLSSAHFELGDHNGAVKYAERAVARAPKRAAYRVSLGDAYLKLLRYKDARKAYGKAKSLGSKQAQSRLDNLDKRSGG